MEENNIKKANEGLSLGKEIIKEYFKEVDKRENERAKKEKEKQRKKSTVLIITYLLLGVFLYFLYIMFGNLFGY